MCLSVCCKRQLDTATGGSKPFQSCPQACARCQQELGGLSFISVQGPWEWICSSEAQEEVPASQGRLWTPSTLPQVTALPTGESLASELRKMLGLLESREIFLWVEVKPNLDLCLWALTSRFGLFSHDMWQHQLVMMLQVTEENQTWTRVNFSHRITAPKNFQST